MPSEYENYKLQQERDARTEADIQHDMQTAQGMIGLVQFVPALLFILFAIVIAAVPAIAIMDVLYQNEYGLAPSFFAIIIGGVILFFLSVPTRSAVAGCEVSLIVGSLATLLPKIGTNHIFILILTMIVYIITASLLLGTEGGVLFKNKVGYIIGTLPALWVTRLTIRATYVICEPNDSFELSYDERTTLILLGTIIILGVILFIITRIAKIKSGELKEKPVLTEEEKKEKRTKFWKKFFKVIKIIVLTILIITFILFCFIVYLLFK